MNRTAWQLCLIMALTTVVAMTVDAAKADPFFPKGSRSDEPTPPSVTVLSPPQDWPCSSDSDVLLNFTVTTPTTAWYTSNGAYIGTTYGYMDPPKCYLDGLEINVTWKYDLYNFKRIYYSANLGRLSNGLHTLKFDVQGSSYVSTETKFDYHIGSNPSFIGSVPLIPVNSSTQVYFVVNVIGWTNETSPIPYASPPRVITIPTDEPTPSAQPSQSPTQNTSPNLSPTNTIPSPSVPEFPSWAILTLLAVTTVLIATAMKKKR